MDLTTILRNVKSRKYKNKADFQTDLALIWENCYEYNSQETHPLRAAARYLKQKAEHHLEYLADKNEKPANPLQGFLSQGISVNGSPAPGSSGPSRGLGARGESLLTVGGDEDAAGESDDGQNDEADFRDAGGTLDGGTQDGQAQRSRRETSVASTSRRANGVSRRSPAVFRPQLNTSLEAAPALIRTPYSMTHLLPVSLNSAGPSFSDKGKAKEILYGNAPPAWFPMPPSSASGTAFDDEDLKLEGYWWGAMSASNEDSLIGGLPSIPQMVDSGPPLKKRRIRRLKTSLDVPNGDDATKASPGKKKKPVSLKKVINQTVDSLHDARNTIHRIQEFQRIEMEGGLLPSRELESEKEKLIKREERLDRSRLRREENERAKLRRKVGGGIGEEEASLHLKKASAGLLAHAGFEGANEMALDLMTRAAVDHISNMGRTLRLLCDGFSHKMSAEEILLHALHENGQIETQHLEAHLKDDIEKENVKVTDMQRKIRQAFKEVTTAPVIEDDMMFANNGEMLMDGNFADELGEDFLGLRDMGIDKEFGLSSLTVPSSLFYGRRRRLAAAHDEKEDLPDYPIPPPFIPLNATTIPTHLPALLHAFYAARIESGLSIVEDDIFDPAHGQIGSLGQIIVKARPDSTAAPTAAAALKKKRERESGEAENGDGDEAKKKSVKKQPVPGVGKGNWVRPSKEQKAKKADKEGTTLPNGTNKPNGTANGDGQEEDAEGEEE
ncbi:uncharacterized protein I303_103616 [Kwoniella dejecticola CBS 10117]|uniref:Bromo domain-containing protein n=1 Tax=Kwoniella dejecticola CBS 10117 TaxID=1296121 RepID=A0A1A6A794_9TREE|nr:uncharacterized protein I303_03638 [Kwoniella dejecticola CBS 10117]OBR85923.1 hypothetical protein I303_03638 [Kwoniella dejecticola CBS 10117]